MVTTFLQNTMENPRVNQRRSDRESIARRIELESDPTAAPELSVPSQLARAFESSPYIPLRKLSYSVVEGTARLDGRVPTFYCKQLAQSIAESIPGIRWVENRIEVSGRFRRPA